MTDDVDDDDDDDDEDNRKCNKASNLDVSKFIAFILGSTIVFVM